MYGFSLITSSSLLLSLLAVGAGVLLLSVCFEGDLMRLLSESQSEDSNFSGFQEMFSVSPESVAFGFDDIRSRLLRFTYNPSLS